MKMILSVFFFLIIVFIVGCGPSQKEINEKRINDSIRISDSIRTVDSLNAIRNFQIGFISIENYLLQPSTPEIVEKAISAKYSIVSKNEEDWKFRDESKSWEAILGIYFEKSSRIVKEIYFTAPGSRVYDYKDQLSKIMGFHLVSSESLPEIGSWLEIYGNSEKGLTAKYFPVDYIGQGLLFFRLYKSENDN